MNQPPLFVSGFELGNLVVNSNLLTFSLAAISALQSEVNPFHQPLSLRCRVEKQATCTIVAFVTSPSYTIHHLQQGGETDLVSSATLKQQNFPHFEFLCSEGNPSFSLHQPAISLFYQHFGELSQLKDQLVDSTTGRLLVDKLLIITGNSLGGSIASLFNLWLLESINPSSKKRPLCITFGSPLAGDIGLQKAILQRSTWNSCFLNVAAEGDPVPSLFLILPPQTALYKPFGSFLLCSELGCTCIDDPEVVSDLLQVMGLDSRRNQVSTDHLLAYYVEIVELIKRLILTRSSLLMASGMDSLVAGINLQLEAIGDRRIQQQQHDMDVVRLIENLKQRERIRMLRKRKALDPIRKLNDVKIRMAYLEWYKKICKFKKIGYYDCYKNNHDKQDRDITRHKKYLTNYWEDQVEEAEKKPYKEGSFINSTWLFAGTNYRRMVEPLTIAEFYREGCKTNYEKNGRPKHFILLEKWAKEDVEKPATDPTPTSKKKQNVSGTLTEDSCFWAKIEEARILCKMLTSGSGSVMEKQLLREFEEYVIEQINNYAVSPEVFLQETSFMKWWDEFESIASNASLINFMKNRRYVQYENGSF